MKARLVLAALLTASVASGAAAQDAPPEFTPATLSSGFTLPAAQLSALDGGLVLLEVGVNDAGAVTRIDTLQGAAPFLAPMLEAVRLWSFAPAYDLAEPEPGAVASSVLVAGFFRPPALFDVGSQAPADDAALPAGGAPFPSQVVAPVFPPQALFDGAVLAEVALDADGLVAAARVLGGDPAFTEVALAAAQGWQFLPALHEGQRVPSNVYVVFGFRQPVTPAGAP